MPKPKPDEVIRHEIVLGSAERQIAKDLRSAIVANRIISPITSMLSTPAGVLVVVGLSLAFIEQYLPPDYQDRDEGSLRDWFETENIAVGTAYAGIFAAIGALFGFNPLTVGAGAVVGGAVGSVHQEIAEEAQAAGVPRVFSYGAFAALVGAAKQLKDLQDELSNEG